MTDKKEPTFLSPDHPVFSHVYGMTFRRKPKREGTPEQQERWRKNNLKLGQMHKDRGGTLESWIAGGGTKESAKKFGITE